MLKLCCCKLHCTVHDYNDTLSLYIYIYKYIYSLNCFPMYSLHIRFIQVNIKHSGFNYQCCFHPYILIPSCTTFSLDLCTQRKSIKYSPCEFDETLNCNLLLRCVQYDCYCSLHYHLQMTTKHTYQNLHSLSTLNQTDEHSVLKVVMSSKGRPKSN